ncbi:HLA class II histocompatibility antigen, DRB1-14 beta chain-like protein [Turdus rufiventris]|nr:HLA class II histocompatibility antigen, DRB1-14 beta chain-like protein [Turdus rufiventris]
MDKVRCVERHIYKRVEYARFDSDVGRYMGLGPFGEKCAQYWNSNPEWMELKRVQLDSYCRYNYKIMALFLVEHRVNRSPSQYIPVHPSDPCAFVSLVDGDDSRRPIRACLSDHSPVARQIRRSECPALDSASQCRALHSQFIPVPPQSIPVHS